MQEKIKALEGEVQRLKKYNSLILIFIFSLSISQLRYAVNQLNFHQSLIQVVEILSQLIQLRDF